MVDTLKTTCAGMGGCWIGCIDMIPEYISAAVGFATLIYLTIKIVKELKNK